MYKAVKETQTSSMLDVSPILVNAVIKSLKCQMLF